jgi:translocation protein SEC66
MGQTDIWAPVLYVTLLIGSLLLFSHFYRKKIAGTRMRCTLPCTSSRPTGKQKFDPWYPIHPERDLYISLLQKTDPPAPDSLLKAALLRRAAADVTRIIRIREDKPALQALMQKGTVGDDLWASCQLAEKELEAELLEVVAEANTFHPGWGQFIFGSAGEVLGHDRIKELLASIDRRHQETGFFWCFYGSMSS